MPRRTSPPNALSRLVAVLLACAVAAAPATAQTGPAAIRGMEAYNRGDFRRAFDLLRRAAEAKDAEALANLGYLYARGHGVAADPAMSLSLYRRAAHLGSSEGMNAIGYRYQFGSGVPQDLGRAVDWFCRALIRGNPRAMNNLAILLARGEGVAQDMEEAISLWRQAAELGRANAMANLGLALLQRQQNEEAVHWLKRAAAEGVEAAQRQLRAMGHHGAFPPPIDYAALMQPAPVGARGHSKVCESPLVS